MRGGVRARKPKQRPGRNAGEHMQSVITPVFVTIQRLRTLADRAGALFALLGIRLLLALEYGDAGIKKWQGSNWFANVQADFPFPFSAIPVDVNWQLATWTELLGALALVLGLATRFFGISLFILTVVAWISVHSGHGYNVCNQGFKLPLLYLAMLTPLILNGPGELSLDYLLFRRKSDAS
jgi:putative oxidoreductase